MNKEHIRQSILCQLRAAFDNATLAASAAHEAATNEESKAENKYDTRGLEASYLAEGQSRRVTELEQEISVYEKLEMADFSESSPIRLTAWVDLESSEGHRQSVFIGPTSGGLKLTLEEGDGLVVTANAPLGKVLLGKSVGDDVVIQPSGYTTYYEIIDVC